MEDRYKYSIINVVECIHGSVSGTGDTPINIEELVEWLKIRISDNGWSPSTIEKYKRYDDTVRELALSALKEYQD